MEESKQSCRHFTSWVWYRGYPDRFLSPITSMPAYYEQLSLVFLVLLVATVHGRNLKVGLHT